MRHHLNTTDSTSLELRRRMSAEELPHTDCKFSESFGRCKGCCIKKATATPVEAQWLTSLPKHL